MANSDPGSANSVDDTLTFVFKLPNGATSPVVIVAGGADVNADGEISNANEVVAFQSKGNNIWERTQDVAGDVTGMIFAVTFTVGANTKWELTITNKKGNVLFQSMNTTIFTTDTVAYHLS